MAKNNAPVTLTDVGSLFSTQAERDEGQKETVISVLLSEIDNFPDHPFKVKDDEEIQRMVESVKQAGILNPVLLRKKEDGRYELISGHRRKRACELAGLTSIPAIVRELDRDSATIYMVDSNLQRETILPSEKAFSYKMRLEAMKRQVGRPSKNNMSQVGTHLRSDAELAEIVGESRNQIQRYIRLTELIPPILQKVDDGKIALSPAVEISYLTAEQQQWLMETMELEDCTPSHAQAIKMKQFAKDGKLTEAVILSIIQEEKPNQKEQLKISKERISKYFPAGTPADKIEDTIIKALELYRKRERARER